MEDAKSIGLELDLHHNDERNRIDFFFKFFGGRGKGLAKRESQGYKIEFCDLFSNRALATKRITDIVEQEVRRVIERMVDANRGFQVASSFTFYPKKESQTADLIDWSQHDPQPTKGKTMHAFEAYALNECQNVQHVFNAIEKAIKERDLNGGDYDVTSVEVRPLSGLQKKILEDVYGYRISPVIEDKKNTKTFYPPVFKNVHVADRVSWGPF